MNNFEFVFSLIGLVLGLSLTEVLGGLVRTLTARPRVKIGWLTPMLGVVVIADVTTFWGMLWQVREMLPPLYPTLGLGVLVTSIYYIAAYLVFPREPEACADFDGHYMSRKRLVMGLILLCNLIVMGATLALGDHWNTQVMIANLSFIVLAAATAFVPWRRVNLALLALLLINYVYIFASP